MYQLFGRHIVLPVTPPIRIEMKFANVARFVVPLLGSPTCAIKIWADVAIQAEFAGLLLCSTTFMLERWDGESESGVGRMKAPK